MHRKPTGKDSIPCSSQKAGGQERERKKRKNKRRKMTLKNERRIEREDMEKQVEQSSDNRCVLARTCTYYRLLYLYTCTITTTVA